LKERVPHIISQRLDGSERWTLRKAQAPPHQSQTENHAREEILSNWYLSHSYSSQIIPAWKRMILDVLKNLVFLR
jgi:hypothetical protein